MLRILTKYKMTILVVFGIFVIISFLLADTLQRLSRSAMMNQKVFEIGGQRVTQIDLQAAAHSVSSFDKMFGRDQRSNTPLLNQLLALPENASDGVVWAIRSSEANRAGLNGGPEDGLLLARDIAEMQVMRTYGTQEQGMADWREKFKAAENLTDEGVSERLETISRNLIGLATSTDRDGREAFAQFRALQRQGELLAQIARPSGPRLMQDARRFDTVTMSYVFVPVDEARAAATAEPSADALAAHFARYKDEPLGRGEFGMGLRQPDRVAFSRLTIDRPKLLAKVRIDPVDVAKKLQAEPAPTGTDPAEHRRALENQLREARTDEIMREAVNVVRAGILKVTGQLPEDGGYRKLPADWSPARVDFGAISRQVVDRVKEQFGVDMEAPAVVAVDTPKSQQELAGDPASASVLFAGMRRGQARVPLFFSLFEARELNAPLSKQPWAGLAKLQVGLPLSDPFEDAGTKSQHFVWVTQVQPAASPTNLDAVREQVVKDARKIAAIESVRKQLEEMTPIALALGMDEVVTQLKAKGISAEIKKNVMANQQQGMQPVDPALNSREAAQDVATRVIEVAQKLDASTRLDELNAKERTLVHAPKGVLGAMIAQITEYKPTTLEDFRRGAGILASSAGPRAVQAELPEHFGLPALIKRLGVTGVEPPKPEAGDAKQP